MANKAEITMRHVRKACEYAGVGLPVNKKGSLYPVKYHWNDKRKDGGRIKFAVGKGTLTIHQRCKIAEYFDKLFPHLSVKVSDYVGYFATVHWTK